MTQPPKKKAIESSVTSVENILQQRLSRRQALGRGAAIAIGAGVVVVGAAGYLAYVSTQGTPTSTTTTSTASSSSSTSSTLSTSSTSSTTSSTSSTLSSSTSSASSMTVPSTQVHFDVWPFRPDLVQKGVDHYNSEMVENVKLDVISASYTSVVET